MSTYLDNAGLTNVLVKIKSLLATKASITAIPTKVSSLENDSGYQTESDVTSKIPTKVSQLTNDSGYLTNSSLSVPTKVSELENDSGYQTSSEVKTSIKNCTGVYTELEATESDDYIYNILKYYSGGDGTQYGFIQRKTYFTPKVKNIISTLQTDGIIPTSASVASQIATALEGITELEFTVVDALPATPTKGTIYLVPKGTYDTNSVTVNQTDSSGNTVTDVVQDSYDEYIWVSESTTDGVTTYNYEKIGSTDVDLSQYAKTADLPTKTSDLTNDSAFQTSTEVGTAITKQFNPINVHNTYFSGGNQIHFVSGVGMSDGKLEVNFNPRNTVEDSAVDGQYVSAVNQTNDKISVTRASLPTVDDSAVDGQYVSSVSQSNGQITVTRATLPSGSGSSDTPIPNDTIDAIFTEVFG